MRVLVIDDNATSLEAAEAFLRASGHQVEGAATGIGATTRLEVWRPDVVLLDLYLPGLDGLAWLQHLREDARYRDLPVVFLTGAADGDLDQILDRQDELAPVAVLRKPCDPTEILSVLEGMVSP